MSHYKHITPLEREKILVLHSHNYWSYVKFEYKLN